MSGEANIEEMSKINEQFASGKKKFFQLKTNNGTATGR